MAGPRKQDFPPGLEGGLEHDDQDHRLGETGQIGPESPGDLPRDHPEWRETPPGKDGEAQEDDDDGR